MMFLVIALMTMAVIGVHADASIDRLVNEDMTSQGWAKVLIKVGLRADLSSIVARAQGNHREKGRVVYSALLQKAEEEQILIRAFLDQSQIPYRSYWITNEIAVTVTSVQLLQQLAALPLVSAIRSNRPFKVDLELPDDDQNNNNNNNNILAKRTTAVAEEVGLAEWNIDWVNAPEVWATGNTGQDGVVMNADTGVQWDHRELINAYRGGVSGQHNYSWWDGVKENAIPGSGPCGINSQVPCDDNNHGTHTTGTAVGTISCGVAPGAKWIGCRNMDRGFGTPESYISCLQWAMAPTLLDGSGADPSLRPHAIGNSYGCTSGEGCQYDSLHEAVEAVRASGIFMAVSAGNSGSSCSTVNDPPGLEPSVISVGATNSQSNSIASYSSRGPVTVWGGQPLRKPELVAPGSGVRSCVVGGGYASYSGTSMASPHINGAVAILVTACPSLAYDVDSLQSILQDAALPLYSSQGCGGDSSSAHPNNVFGHGQLVLDNAVALCKQRGF